LFLRQSVWTLVNVKRLAFLAPKYVFSRSRRLFGLRFQFRDFFQFSAAIGLFRDVGGDVAHSLAWGFGFHFVDCPPETIITVDVSLPYRRSLKRKRESSQPQELSAAFLQNQQNTSSPSPAHSPQPPSASTAAT